MVREDLPEFYSNKNLGALKPLGYDVMASKLAEECCLS